MSARSITTALLFGLVGCGGTSKEVISTPAPTTPATPVAPKPPAIQNSILVGQKVGDCGTYNQVPVYEVFRGTPLSVDATNSYAYLPIPSFPRSGAQANTNGNKMFLPIETAFDKNACAHELNIPVERLNVAEFTSASYELVAGDNHSEEYLIDGQLAGALPQRVFENLSARLCQGKIVLCGALKAGVGTTAAMDSRAVLLVSG